jgi:hypothetical protein
MFTFCKPGFKHIHLNPGLQNINIETMPTEYFGKLLGKFYAEIKTRRWRLRARIIENYAV